tara:strand:- start:41 stop:670 length:630 start_codon:yes stop_codon:yes gene_type:complete
MNRLLEKIKSNNTPQKIPIKIEKYSIANSCFYNVEDKISIDNGEIVYGWKLHQSKFLAEAERHAVWKSPIGELIDITSGSTNQNSILFLEEDKGWKYTGEFTDNLRINLTNNPLVDDLILLNETISKLWKKSKRKSRLELDILEPINNLINLLEKDKVKRGIFIERGNTLNSNCYCENNNVYKECHGLELDKVYNELFKKVNELIKTSC